MMPVDAVLLSFSLVCAMTDMIHKKIFNAITFPIFFAGFLYHVLLLVEFDSIWNGFLYLSTYIGIGVLWFVLCTGLMSLKVIAAGDVKFMMAFYAWVGPSDMPFALACMFISAGLVSILYMIEDGRLLDFVKGLWLSLYAKRWMLTPSRVYQRPLGLAMFLGTWAYLIWK